MVTSLTILLGIDIASYCSLLAKLKRSMTHSCCALNSRLSPFLFLFRYPILPLRPLPRLRSALVSFFAPGM
jgi:hypothetical protein